MRTHSAILVTAIVAFVGGLFIAVTTPPVPRS
jgi:hypothetical protein